MKLQEILNKFPNFFLASENDNQEILEFFKTVPMKGEGLELFYDRSPNFFSFCKYQSDKVFIFLAKDEGKIQGVATMIIRPGYIQGVQKNVAYLGDLRVAPNRKITLQWRKLFIEVLGQAKNIEEFLGCDDFLTAVMEGNILAKNNLTKLQYKLGYRHVAKYKMINVWLRCWKIKSQFKPFSVHQNSINEFIHFMQQEHSKYDFGFYMEFEFFYRMQQWHNLQLDNFLMVKRGEEIIAALVLWEPSQAKKIIIKSIPWYLRWTQLIPSFPKVGKELKLLYLNTLTFKSGLSGEEKNDVLNSILNYTFELDSMKKYHAISFAEFENENFNNALKGFLVSKTKLELYTIDFEDSKKYQLPVGFEMGLV
jgi:hypothetical protein